MQSKHFQNDSIDVCLCSFTLEHVGHCTGASRLIMKPTFFDPDVCVSKHTLRKPALRQRVSCKRSL